MIKLIVISYLVVSVLLVISYINSEFKFDMESVPIKEFSFKKERHLFERFWILFPLSLMMVLIIILFATIKMRLSEK